MSKKTLYQFVGTLLAVIILIAGIVIYKNSQNSNNSSNTKDGFSQVSKQKETSETIQTDDLGTETVQNEDIKKPGIWADYSKVYLDNAKEGKVVLFFNASWCPSCQVTVRNIEKNLEDIPGDLTILSLDYDQSLELRKEYGVTYQHTFVQVDQDGKQIKKTTGLEDIQAIVDFTIE